MATDEFIERLKALEELDGREISDIISEIKHNLDESKKYDAYGIGDFTIPSRLLRRLVEEIEYEQRERQSPYGVC